MPWWLVSFIILFKYNLELEMVLMGITPKTRVYIMSSVPLRIDTWVLLASIVLFIERAITCIMQPLFYNVLIWVILLFRCVICQMEYKRGDKRITLPCKHLYHASCGNKWLSINKARYLPFYHKLNKWFWCLFYYLLKYMFFILYSGVIVSGLPYMLYRSICRQIKTKIKDQGMCNLHMFLFKGWVFFFIHRNTFIRFSW